MDIERKIILVDDEEHIRQAAEEVLRLSGYDVVSFSNPREARALLSPDWPGILITDVKMDGMSGIDLMKYSLQVDADIPVILISAFGDIAMAVDALHHGAYDFIEKPFDPKHLLDAVHRSMEKRCLVLENRSLRNVLNSQLENQEVLGVSPEICMIREQVANIADVDADILLHGETGSGKDMIARAIHRSSHRRDKPFVAVNCGAIPDSIIENELFGHEAGAFTGASTRQVGKFEHANGGTVFLDEIESMPETLGVKLLRVIQERTVERLGSTKPIPLDIRIITATKVDLKQASDDGKFRLDLYYRLAVIHMDIPPLRNRQLDIPFLFQHFVDKAAERFNRVAEAVTPELMAKLLGHDWPGNVRELQSTAERYVLGYLQEPFGASSLPVRHNAEAQLSLRDMVANYERNLIEQQLRQDKGDISASYTALGVPRKTFEDKLRKYEINRKAYK